MFPFNVLRSEASIANLQQVHWQNGLYYPHCRSGVVIEHGCYREYQRYLCKDCSRTFNTKTGSESRASLVRRWLCHTEASQKISPRRISERSSYAAESYANLIEKLAKKSYDPYSNSPTTCFTYAKRTVTPRVTADLRAARCLSSLLAASR